MRSAAVAACLSLALSGCLLADAPADGSASPSPPGPAIDACPQAKSFRPTLLNATIETTKGAIAIELYGDKSPVTVCNFLRYAESKFYEGVVWHRICRHVIQAGGEDPYTHDQKKANEPIRNEANQSRLRNYRYTLGMARGFNDSNPSDPATVDSATSHFFVNLQDNNYLDFDGKYAPGFAVFGNVTGGQSVVADIADTTTVPDAPEQAGPLYQGCRGAPAPHDRTTILRVGVVG